MFDKLYFLGKGHELYFGPTVPDCLQFFEDAGYKCPEYENPADFLLDLVNTTDTVYDDEDDGNSKGKDVQLVDMEEAKATGQSNDDNEEKSEKVDSRHEIIMKLAAAYQESEYRQRALDYEVPTTSHGDRVFNTIAKEFYITPIYNQVWIITLRSFIFKWRGMSQYILHKLWL